jgi:hypothetical protein
LTLFIKATTATFKILHGELAKTSNKYCSARNSHKKINPSSRRRGGPILKHVNGLATNRNMVMGLDGGPKSRITVLVKAISKLLLCSRDIPSLYPWNREIPRRVITDESGRFRRSVLSEFNNK